MPAYLMIGLALLLALLVLGRVFATANPGTLAQILRWSGVIVLGGLSLLALLRGQVLPGMLFGAAAAWVWRGMRFRAWRRAPSPGGASNVETAWLAMSLDHESGTVDGEIRQGAFSGRRLSDLNLEELLDLYDAMRDDDPRSVALLEAFLDRMHEGWRDELVKRAPSGQESGSQRRGWGRPGSERMSRRDALEILGLGDAASEDEIKDAHRELMKKHHPDRGGSAYFAAKLNQAKEVLLKGGG